MLEITETKLSKNVVTTGEKFTISVEIRETADYPYDYPYDFPVTYTGIAEPAQAYKNKKGEVHEENG